MKNNYYLTIIIKNTKGSVDDICVKNIYPSSCFNISSEIEDIIEIDIDNLFMRQNGIEYILSFKEYNKEKLMIGTNEGELSLDRVLKINEYSDIQYFKFALRKDDITDKIINAIYIVSIDEINSTSCSINLIIKNIRIKL